MIDSAILQKIRNGVCAIGYLTVPLVDYVKYYELPGMFKVVGTGFLVREKTVITCAHVLDDLQSEQRRNSIPDAQRFVSFVVPRTKGPLGITVRLIRRTGAAREARVDVGFIDFEVVHPEHFRDIVPLAVADTFDFGVSEHIAAFGYPHGSTLSEKGGTLRFGPLVQQGWVSGLSPYEGAPSIDELLLDIRADEGMSGSPIFSTQTGTVVAILQSGVRSVPSEATFLTTTVFGQPVDRAKLFGWLDAYDRDVVP